MPTKKATFALNNADVDVDRQWLRLGGRNGQATRTSRADGLQTGFMQLTHRPTKIKVEGTVAEGHYSRTKMTAEMEALRLNLQGQLENLVARHLRLPGRNK